MSQDKFFWVDAFSGMPFGGNPAVVCVLTDHRSDDYLQGLAAEFNVSESVFLLKSGDHYDIRWFTPIKELPLVGHASLAAAHVVLRELEPGRNAVDFHSHLSGRLPTRLQNEDLAIVLPADEAAEIESPQHLLEGLGKVPTLVLRGRHYVAVFNSAADVKDIRPNPDILKQLDLPTIAVTALGDDEDYVLRFFAPANGVTEDPVSGVAQCTLVPFWADRLGKRELRSRQLSEKGGTMVCTLKEDGVQVAGPCCTIASGNLRHS